MLGLQIAFDVPDSEDFPEKAAFEYARDNGLRVTTHAGVWGATTDVGIDHMYDAGVMDDTDHLRARGDASARESYQKIAATGGTVSVATESEQSAGQGYPSTWELRKYGIPASLSMDTSVWWSADFFSAMRATLSADRSRDHLEAHAKNETIVGATGCAPRTSSGWRPWAARSRSAWRTRSARSPRARRPTCC